MQTHSSLLCILVTLSLPGTLLSSEDEIIHDSDLNQRQRVSQELNDTSQHTKYLLYEVNPGEGFNLRRDVYIRVANLVQYMQNEGNNIVLVLPPWKGLYHWKSRISQTALPWKKFFDINNMNKYVPVIEFNSFLQLQQSPGIDMIVYLQRHPDGFSNGWEEKIEDDKCTDNPVYWKDADGTYHGYFWGLEYVYGKSFKCVSVQGSAKILADYIRNANARSIFIDRFEEVLHIAYGDSEFWRARRSLVFAKPLRKRADKFRLEYLNSTDESDLTPYIDEDWRLQVPKDGSAVGGDYLAVHLRRGDFLFSGRKGVPTITAVRKQISKLLKKLKLKEVFLATDGSDKGDPLFHSKLDLMTQSVKAQNKKGVCLKQIRKVPLSYDALKASIFVSHQIRKLTRDPYCLFTIMDVEKCMVSFSEVILKFPGNVKFPGYREIVEKDFDLLSSTG